MVLEKAGLKKLAKKIVQRLKGGEVFLLFGDLGSGKTYFTQQIGYFLKAKRVKSPSFVILEIHKTCKDFYLAHFDFYRLSKKQVGDFEWSDFLFSPQYVSFIEWGEKIEPYLKNKKYFKIDFKIVSLRKRQIALSNNLEKWLKK